MFYGGRVHDDGISRAIQILYLHGFKFPYITDKELERLAYTGYVELDWKGSPQTIELKPTDRLQFTSG